MPSPALNLGEGTVVSKVVSPHLWTTPPNLYQEAIKIYKGIPFIVGQGDFLGCALGVCCNFRGFVVVVVVVLMGPSNKHI